MVPVTCAVVDGDDEGEELCPLTAAMIAMRPTRIFFL